MKSVLISIKPKYCELIASGKKTIEVRKSHPKIETPFKCYIYCTYGQENENYMLGKRGKIIGEFVCERIVENFKYLVTPKGLECACLSEQEVCDYLGFNGGYGWHISDLKIYDKPKPIMQFYKPCPIEWKNCPGCEFYSTNTGYCMNNIDRPPQSYMYVEEL